MMVRTFGSKGKLCRAGLAILGTCPHTDATSQPVTDSPTGEISRAQLQTRLDDFNAHLLESTSATLTLENWCTVHHPAADPRIVARVKKTAFKPLSPKQRVRLKIGRSEPVHYRHVTLSCGNIVLSEAENWFVPSRLTAEMNRQLAITEMPFGRVIRPLMPTRRTFSVKILWSPKQADSPGQYGLTVRSIPAHVMRHRALVLDAHGLPLAEVVETYTRALVAF